MNMTITEVLFILSSAIALPVVAVLTIAFFTGGLDETEHAKYVVIAEPEPDWWDETQSLSQGGGAS